MSTENPEAVLVLRQMSAGYNGTAVVHDLDLTVGAGEVVALLGSNGAGKTTTLLAVSGLLPRLGGDIEVLGESIALHRRVRTNDVAKLSRRGVAHVPEDRGLFFDLTAREHLRLGRRPRCANVADEQLLEWFPALAKVLDRRAGLLSGGEQQMLALAVAVSGSPRLLLVDEMSLGLAPLVVESLLPVLRSIADTTGAGMVLVEQHVDLVLEIADRAVVMRRGRIVAQGTAVEVADRRAELEAGYFGESPDAGAAAMPRRGDGGNTTEGTLEP